MMHFALEGTMGFVKRFVPIALSLAIVLVITVAILWIRRDTLGPGHLIFIYLLPTACVAFMYSSMPAIVVTLGAIVCAAFFFYDPVYSFLVADPRHVGELICFAGLALIGTKCVAELMRPIGNPQDEKTSIRLWQNVRGSRPKATA
jgi:K+-sensing histidine kinase KdpD